MTSIKQGLIDRMDDTLFALMEVEVSWEKTEKWLGYSDRWNDIHEELAAPNIQSVAEFYYSVLLVEDEHEVVVAKKVGSNEFLFGVVVIGDCFIRVSAIDIADLLVGDTDDPNTMDRQTDAVRTIVQRLNNIVL